MIADRPKVVVLCGSSRFVDIMAVCAWLLERDEGAIALGLHLLPGWYSAEAIHDHLAEHEGCAQDMDELHLRKINLAMETNGSVFVVNHGDYIGQSTEREVMYAKHLGVDVRWFTHDPIGAKVRKLMAEAWERAPGALFAEEGT